MKVTIKVPFFFFFLGAAMGEFENNSVEDPEEMTRQFHIEQNKETREIIKSDMDKHFSNLGLMMSERNTETLSILKRNQEELFANLSREINENMGSLYLNLSDSFTQKLAKSDLKILGELENLKTTFNGNPQPLMQRTAVEEVSTDSGTIEFDMRPNSGLRRKIWIIQGNGNEWNFSFVLVENRLGENAHLTAWSIGGGYHVWNGSQVDWRKEVTFSGVNIILVTLSMVGNSELTPTEQPSFKLTFSSAIAKNYSYVNSKEVRRSEGLQSVSYPSHNNQNYPWNSFFYSLIAPYSGSQFRLTLKYLDIPRTPPQCTDKWFGVLVLQESPTRSNYELLPAFDTKRCGRTGETSEFLGYAEVAFVWFWSNTEEVGKGFRIEIEPSE